MGLIKALKYFQSASHQMGKEVEYRLYSWGEIQGPWDGDREHSPEARYILRDFPFKLFSSSSPNGPLPQKLCLTFKTPYEVRGEGTRGYYSDETAEEFCGFLSLVTRRRVFPGGLTRSDGLPIEEKVNIYERSLFQEKQRPKIIDPKEIEQLLNVLQDMPERVTDSFILASRLYHSAVEMMYTEPDFSYLFLVTAVEAISGAAYEGYKLTSKEEQESFLDKRRGGWRDLSGSLSTSEEEKLRELLLRNEKFISVKFSRFIEDNVPGRFWSETMDDARPAALSDIATSELERIEKGKLIQTLKNIYKARSRLIHDGVRLPASILFGLWQWMKPETFLKMATEMKANLKNDLGTPRLLIPPLLTFERLVSYSMVEFLRKQRKET